jgi:hypothetical protein
MGVVPYGQTDGRTDMTKLTVAFRNFATAPKSKRSDILEAICYVFPLIFLVWFLSDHESMSVP